MFRVKSASSVATNTSLMKSPLDLKPSSMPRKRIEWSLLFWTTPRLRNVSISVLSSTVRQDLFLPF